MTDANRTNLAIWTIGHSNHSMADFVDLLKAHGIQVVADVRSRPYSRYAPRFNRQSLAEALPEHGLRYVFMGRELGGKPDDPAFTLADGTLNLEAFKARPEFQEGMRRAMTLAGESRLCLMCSEGDPLKCHRTMLLAPELKKRGLKILQILTDGNLLEYQDEKVQPEQRQMRLF